MMVMFLKSGDYLPDGDTFTRMQIAPPVYRILEADRHGYRQICFLSLLSGIAALGIAIIPRRNR
jgi:hypothetical protein